MNAHFQNYQQDLEQYLPPKQILSLTVFKLFNWQLGDVVISSGAKQGSTWMQNIVHQIRTGGDAEFEKIDEVCPRLENVEYPGQSDRERLERFEKNAFSQYPFRVLKTHLAPPEFPFHSQVKYIIPVRNAKDTLVSFYHYRNSTTEEFQALWGGRPHHFPSFDVCFDCYLYFKSYWTLINAWLPYRHAENVLFIHYTDLKQDLEGNLKRIASFLDVKIPSEQWPDIVEKCGFQWMKKNSSKFEPRVLNVPIINKGRMIRKGKIGDSVNWFTAKHEARWEAIHKQLLPDEAIRTWCDQGGELP